MMKLFTDGGSRGNPGPGAIAAVIKDLENQIVHDEGKFIGTCTNNEAEYKALIMGLENASTLKITELACFLDSELVVKQLNGAYKVRHENIIPLFQQVVSLKKNFKSITFTHVARAQNKDADKLVNQVLDSVQ